MRTFQALSVVLSCALASEAAAQVATGAILPIAVPHANVAPAGALAEGGLTLSLTAMRVRWHPEADGGPSVTVDAFGVEGAPPSIPGPLVRVPAGTRIESSIRNTLVDTLLVFGLSGATGDTIRIAPGATGRTGFTAATPGTYAYGGATVVGDSIHLLGTGHQLLGALIVDGPDPVPDRVFVISLWTSDTAGFVMAINGRSWPHTERLDVEVGKPVHWRVINGTRDRHPMHLHGFYFRVDSRGRWDADSAITGARPMVVTEAVPVHGTFTMTWTAERAGNWLFHCHDALHTSWRRRYNLMGMRPPPTPPVHDVAHHVEEDMSGLVLGIRARGELPEARHTLATNGHGVDSTLTRRIRIVVNGKPGVYGREPGLSYITAEGADPSRDSLEVPARPLVLTRGEPAEITVVNRLAMGTGVHWHGIELESYYDGVAGWSGADTTLAPMIEPEDSFVVRMTPPRAGTFIFHAHVDDMRQIALGLYGALLVLPPGATWNVDRDHVFVLGQVGRGPGRIIAINGSGEPEALHLRAAVKHRLRIINIAIQDDAVVTLQKAGAYPSLVRWRAIAKDGAELDADHAVESPARLLIAPGETYDYEVSLPPGDYLLRSSSLTDVNLTIRVPAEAPPGAPATTLGNVVDVAASEYAFHAPDTIPANLTTFRLRQEGRVKGGIHLSAAARDSLATHAGDATDGLHMLWVVRLDSGRTVADLFAAQRADSATPWAHLLGGPAFTYPPRTTNATIALEPGNYALVCYVGSAREDRRRYHLLKGMFRALTVVPSSEPARPLPEPDVVATVDSAGRTRFSAPIAKAGTWRILVRNQGARRLEFGVVRVLPGHTADEALAWRRSDGTPPAREPWGGVVGVGRGDSLLTTIEFPPGTYIAHGEPFVVNE